MDDSNYSGLKGRTYFVQHLVAERALRGLRAFIGLSDFIYYRLEYFLGKLNAMQREVVFARFVLPKNTSLTKPSILLGSSKLNRFLTA